MINRLQSWWTRGKKPDPIWLIVRQGNADIIRADVEFLMINRKVSGQPLLTIHNPGFPKVVIDLERHPSPLEVDE